jgi:hypothetical protein
MGMDAGHETHAAGQAESVGQTRPNRKTVWYVKRTNFRCFWCGKIVRKVLKIVDPTTFAQFWSVPEILKAEDVGYDSFCRDCAIEYITRR